MRKEKVSEEISSSLVRKIPELKELEEKLIKGFKVGFSKKELNDLSEKLGNTVQKEEEEPETESKDEKAEEGIEGVSTDQSI